MTQDELVQNLLENAKSDLSTYWSKLPDERRLSLVGLEEEVRSMARAIERGLWELLVGLLDDLAVELEGKCRCRRRREKRRGSIHVDVLGHRITFQCTYLYCRHCHRGVCPVRRWLGVESGGVSLAFERALTDLTTRMTFGDAVQSMDEHHDQALDRTKAERVTYDVARDAQRYLQERRNKARQRLNSGDDEGAEQLVFTADGGAVPVGKLERPATSKGPKTEKRKLSKGKRTIAGREARFIAVRPADSKAERTVDCHIAPYENTRYTGERMLAAAIEAGLRDRTKIHGVFDMGKWIHTQFEEQFSAYNRTACADIMHVASYLIDAGRVILDQEHATGWGMERKRRMLAGEHEDILAELVEHTCDSGCVSNDTGKCLVRVAETYLDNNRDYMKGYRDFMADGLPVGSGEAESGIRHIIKRRMAIAGAWTEENASLMLALLTVRASGWWDDFWAWRAERDKDAWHERQKTTYQPKFRGKTTQRSLEAA